MRTNLVVYNLETDQSSVVLASAVAWIREFSSHFEKVFVYSTHVGTYDLPTNVIVSELGGGSFTGRVKALKNLYFSVKKMNGLQSGFVVFHHMSSRTLAILGPIYKLLGIKQVLWYSHNFASLDLKIGLPFVDYVVSPTDRSFPLKTNKLVVTGHGIETFHRMHKSDTDRSGILSVGRFARVKRYELLADGLAELAENKNFDITILGPANAQDKYKSDLSKYFCAQGIRHSFLEAIDHDSVRQFMYLFDYFYSGTPNSVDKAAIEAAYAGCFVLTTSPETMRLTGMSDVWQFLGLGTPATIKEQIQLLEVLPNEIKSEAREVVRSCSVNLNKLSNTIEKISNLLKEEI